MADNGIKEDKTNRVGSMRQAPPLPLPRGGLSAERFTAPAGRPAAGAEPSRGGHRHRRRAHRHPRGYLPALQMSPENAKWLVRPTLLPRRPTEKNLFDTLSSRTPLARLHPFERICHHQISISSITFTPNSLFWPIFVSCSAPQITIREMLSGL